jgi:HK97 family phage major capsid protein
LAEAGTLTDSKFKLGMLELNLKKLGCLGYSTDELLEDSTANEGLLLRSFQAETKFTVEDSVYQGDGQGKPLGILNGPSTVSQAIEATQTIANSNTFIATNTLKMMSRLPAGSLGNAVWIANIELLPTIATATISGTAGAVPVYIPPAGAQDSPFGTLWGRPILFVEYAAAPGTVGDIVLADLSQYAVATKGGARLDQSMHVKFLTDEMTYRLIYRIDGQPLPRSAVTPYKGALSRSPFVTLAVRS